MKSMKDRTGTCTRKTKETEITVSINLDGQGENRISTGVGFFDHMLDGFARHGLFDLQVEAKGDLETGCHHTVEDTGIVLGKAIAEALGEKRGIKRFGHFILPMDEALALCAVDLSGRPYLNYQDRIFERLLMENGIEISGGQGRILFILWKNDHLTISEISRATSLAKNTVSIVVEGMVNKNILERHTNPENRRQTIVSLTDKWIT